MYYFNTVSLARKLPSMDDAGCDVRALVTVFDSGGGSAARTALSKATRHGGVQLSRMNRGFQEPVFPAAGQRPARRGGPAARTPIYGATSLGNYINHNKYLLIDGTYRGVAGQKVVLTGTVNWSDAGFRRSDEVLLQIRDRSVYAAYAANFDALVDVKRPGRIPGGRVKTRGSSLRIEGQLRRLDWNRRIHRGWAAEKVQLQFRTKTGSYRTVRVVRTGVRGRLVTWVHRTRSGYWRLVAPGSSISRRVVQRRVYVPKA